MAGVADRLACDIELLQDGGGDALGEEAGQQVLGFDLGASVRLGLPLRLV